MSSPPAAPVELSVDGELATLTLTRPETRNAQDPEMWAALAEAGRSLPGSVRVVVVRGEGKSFSAGLDRNQFGMLAELGRDPGLVQRIEGFQGAFTWLTRPDVVSVAAVQGHAIGAGFQLALACDLRVAAAGTVFSMKETSLGIVPDLTGTHPLVAAVGLPRAVEWCLTGRMVTAEEALAAGMLNAVTDDLDKAVEELVSAVLASPRDAVIETKALLQGAARRTPEEQWKAEREAQARVLRELSET
ncbi:MAG TPA: enoyl-CoA hydratase/isomerase family protein [Mycobacteriales bacterium]|nr:enoyl-CoA hydratase/isomerase family protein [Mycobacteriales bacterium]